MLAGRKLLLADDSATIQKVIELTFADEGVRVVAFGNGDAAVEHLDEVAPDIVLADVFMPGKSGYQVCEHIKKNEKLKHIPVMLLVGSFEPFDEAEARRVGADDILTKPFQSIRRLIDRVGSLVGGRPASQEEVSTAELPHSDKWSDKTATPEHKLDTDELAMTTADTQPLPVELKAQMEKEKRPKFASVSTAAPTMKTAAPGMSHDVHTEDDSLLDLGEFEPASTASAASEDFVLDLDEGQYDESVTKLYDDDAPTHRHFVAPEVVQTASRESSSAFEYQPEVQARVAEPYQPVESYRESEVVPYEDQVHELSMESSYDTTPPHAATDAPQTFSNAPAGGLSPEMIDAIARRAVEMMSEKIVREVAWDVVPDLAELLIKRQLEEKESQHK
ncbi:MAG TPA: response regulator [Pyrinomonadaceae bacterium]